MKELLKNNQLFTISFVWLMVLNLLFPLVNEYYTNDSTEIERGFLFNLMTINYGINFIGLLYSVFLGLFVSIAINSIKYIGKSSIKYIRIIIFAVISIFLYIYIRDVSDYNHRGNAISSETIIILTCIQIFAGVLMIRKSSDNKVEPVSTKDFSEEEEEEQ